MVPLAILALCAASEWPLWDRYVEEFVTADGRIVDRTTDDRSTSEGQAYALFFAVAANDRVTFDRVLRWTEQNLARGDLSAHLPAWHWGRRGDGSWGVLDANAASDADLWLAYTLLEAARLWGRPELEPRAFALLANVGAHETKRVPRLGQVLLPGPVGFVLHRGRTVRLNPSYLPPFLLRRLAVSGAPGPWKELVGTSQRVLRASLQSGFAADWLLFGRGRFTRDTVRPPVSSYDAIRVPLWLALTNDGDPMRVELLPRATGGLQHWRRTGRVAETFAFATNRTAGRAPPGFIATQLAVAKALGDEAATSALDAALAATLVDGLHGSPPAYYDQNLALFARGWVEGRFHFGLNGWLHPSWEATCTRP